MPQNIHKRLHQLEAEKLTLSRRIEATTTEILILKRRINKQIDHASFVSDRYLNLIKSPPKEYNPEMNGVELAAFALHQLKSCTTADASFHVLQFDHNLVPGSVYARIGMGLLKLYRCKLIDMEVIKRVRVYKWIEKAL